MREWSLLVSLSVLISGIVSGEGKPGDWFKFDLNSLSRLNPRQARQAKANDFTCPNTDLLTTVAKNAQIGVDTLWTIASVAPGFTEMRAVLYDDFIRLTLFSSMEGRIVETLIAAKGELNGTAVKYSGFSPEMKTVVIVHGFQSDREAEWVQRMTEAYLKFPGVTVIVVNWSTLAHFSLGYVQAARNTVEVANQFKHLAKAIVETYPNAEFGSIHLIGHSLGAQVVGMIGKHFKNVTNAWLLKWPVERITGLDPAHPCFTDTKFVLDEEDAPFVDIIHTSGNREFPANFGTLKPMGHVDFYVNGGQLQPGCIINVPLLLYLGTSVPANVYASTCSHGRAAEYFIESLEVAASGQGSFLTGIKWDYDISQALSYTYENQCVDDCQHMGLNADRSRPGNYFVPTAKNAPYYDIKDEDREAVAKELERIGKQEKPDYM